VKLILAVSHYSERFRTIDLDFAVLQQLNIERIGITETEVGDEHMSFPVKEQERYSQVVVAKMRSRALLHD